MEFGLLGKLIFVRHGETKYTDIPPDLTKSGQKRLRRETVPKIQQMIDGQPIKIISSPVVRAIGTASIIAKELQHKKEIIIEQEIRAAEVRDSKKGKETFEKHTTAGGPRALALSYSTDDVYIDPKVFEPRDEVRARFFKYLARIIGQIATSNERPHIILVSHYETIFNLVEEFYKLDYEKEDPLRFGEVIELSIYRTETENLVGVIASFRKGVISCRGFNCEQERFVK